jgi:hypothetical protein
VTATKTPGAVAALGASISDQLGRRVIPETNSQQRLPQASVRAGAQAGARTPEQRSADLLAAREFHQIQKFVAACRRQWPGARIVLRPDHDAASAPADARADNLTPKQNGGSNGSGME